MKLKSFVTLVAFFAFCHWSCSSTNEKQSSQEEDPTMVKVLANDSGFKYIGRILRLKNGRVQFSYPGVSIRANFQGDALDIIVTDMGIGGLDHTNYLNVIVDNGTPMVVELKTGVSTYQIARNLSEGTHSLEIFKRTESSVGTIEFGGIKLRKGHALASPPRLPQRKILFIGNSITCAYGNDTIIPSNPNSGFNSKHENNYNGYGAITARGLDAQYVAVAYSGIGLQRNYGGETETMPRIYNNIIPNDYEHHWNHANYMPDVIVVNLGTNDFSAERLGHGDVDSSSFVRAYLRFIGVLKKHHPQATVICLVGPMMTDYYPAGAKHWTRIQKYVKAVVAKSIEKGDSKTYYVKFDPQSPPYGEDWHPATATHVKMGNQLIEFIGKLNPWSDTK